MSYDHPRKICSARGCEDLAMPGGSQCEEHVVARRLDHADRKAQAKLVAVAREGAEFYRTARWKRLRLIHLDAHPLCSDCIGVGLVVSATDVDHIRPHRGDARLFWDRRNWQSLCHRCHSRKTAREVWHGAGDSPGWSIPFRLKPAAVPVTLVCGPPGAGKSTWVRREARPSDVVVDFDIYLSEVGGRKWDTDPDKVRAAFRRRDDVLRSLALRDRGRAFVIAVAPTTDERRAWCAALGPDTAVVMLAEPPEVCKARIMADDRRQHAVAAMFDGVDAWWQRFEAAA